MASYMKALGGRVHGIALMVGASLALAGCGSITIPLTQSNPPGAAPEITAATAPVGAGVAGTAASALAYETVGDTDWEEIRKTVASSLMVTPETRLEWSNPRTGSSGTVSGLSASRAVNGASCRDFDATIAKIDGVRLYRAQACQGFSGSWEIVKTVAADKAG